MKTGKEGKREIKWKLDDYDAIGTDVHISSCILGKKISYKASWEDGAPTIVQLYCYASETSVL